MGLDRRRKKGVRCGAEWVLYGWCMAGEVWQRWQKTVAWRGRFGLLSGDKKSAAADRPERGVEVEWSGHSNKPTARCGHACAYQLSLCLSMFHASLPMLVDTERLVLCIGCVPGLLSRCTIHVFEGGNDPPQ